MVGHFKMYLKGGRTVGRGEGATSFVNFNLTPFRESRVLCLIKFFMVSQFWGLQQYIKIFILGPVASVFVTNTPTY